MSHRAVNISRVLSNGNVSLSLILVCYKLLQIYYSRVKFTGYIAYNFCKSNIIHDYIYEMFKNLRSEISINEALF